MTFLLVDDGLVGFDVRPAVMVSGDSVLPSADSSPAAPGRLALPDTERSTNLRITEQEWRAAVGDEIGEHSWPVRVESDGRLIVATTDAIWAFELTHQDKAILARLPAGITSIRFRVKREYEERPQATPEPTTRRGRYAEYLQSDHWRSVREWALERAGHRCQVCNASDATLHAHHRTYERIGAELPGDLIVLCAECHAIFHAAGRLAQ